MAPILVTLWQWRRAILWLSIVAAIALMGWRVTAWREAYKALPEVEAQLAAERACEVGSACEKRAATLALEAAQEAAEKAAGAVQGALAREEAAQREASEWRRKFRQAQQENPECADWSRQRVACPL
jgi:hypothetical protein